jgi:hypothetical protein
MNGQRATVTGLFEVCRRLTWVGGVFIISLHQSHAASARPRRCSDDERKLLLSKSSSDTPYTLRCSLTLKMGDIVERPLLIAGPESNGLSIDCGGGILGLPGPRTEHSVPTIAINSIWLDNLKNFVRPADIEIRNCKLRGSIVIGARVQGSGAPKIWTLSRQPDFTQKSQDSAPSRVRIENVYFEASGGIPVYAARGTTELTIEGSKFVGRAALAIYASFESARHRFIGNLFDLNTSREIIALDGSAYNVIEGNIFYLRDMPAISLYRNCGENGVIRHQVPAYNTIVRNRIFMTSASVTRPIVENARRGHPAAYCDLDRGYPFGSSASDDDGGHDNILEPNDVIVD